MSAALIEELIQIDMNIDNADIRSYTNFDDEDWALIRLSRYKDISNLVLLTPMVFIADIDCDESFSKKAALNTIEAVENELNKQFRVYETYKGYRLFDTQETLNLTNYTEKVRAEALLDLLNADLKYKDYCTFRRKYAARLSPKQHRPDEYTVADLVKIGFTPTKPEIITVLKLHDEMCFDDVNWCDKWRSLDLTKPESNTATTDIIEF